MKYVVCSISLFFSLFTSGLSANPISLIIDEAGDGEYMLMGPRGISTTSSGDVIVAGSDSNNVFRITPEGVITEIIDDLGDNNDAFLIQPWSTAVDGMDNVYLVGRGTDNAFRISPGGEIDELIGPTGDGNGNPLTFPHDLALDSDGNLYVSGRDSDNVFRIAPDGDITEIIDGNGDGAGNDLRGARGVAVDASGNVFVAGSETNNVFRIEVNGTITEIIDADGDGESNTLNTPRHLDVDSEGNVYVAGRISRNVFKITPEGVITEVIDTSDIGSGYESFRPFHFSLDSSDNIFIASGFDNDNVLRVSSGAPLTGDGVVIITPEGTVTEIIDAEGDGSGNALSYASNVFAVDPLTIYVAGNISNNVFKVDLTPPSPETEPENQPPSVSAGSDQEVSYLSTVSGAPVVLSGQASDPDGDIVESGWYRGEDLVSAESVVNLLLEEGVYAFTYRATDNDGAEAQDTITVSVERFQAFGGIKPDSSLGLPENNIGVYIAGSNSIESCLRVREGGLFIDYEGLGQIGISYEVTGPDTMEVISYGPFNPDGLLTNTGEFPSCSGVFDLDTGELMDLILYQGTVFQAVFRMDAGTETLRLVSAEEVSED